MRNPVFLPRTIGIELVRGCNFACKMCPVTSNTPFEQQKLQFIDLKLLEKLVGEIDRWPSIDTIWYFHFGEPMAHPSYRECLEILNRSLVAKKASVIQYTNGSLLTGDKADAIIEIPVIKKLVFSFDGFGDKESFELVRGPHFDLVLNNIKEFSGKARRYRSDLSLATCTILPREGEIAGLAIRDRNLALKQLDEVFAPLNIRVETRDMHDYSGNDRLQISGPKALKVFGGCLFVEQDSIYFTVNGCAQPCCAVYSETFNIGNFPEQGFGELLNNKAMNTIRHALRLDRRSTLPFCKNCSLSIGVCLNRVDFERFWKERDQQGLIQDLGERRYILGDLMSGEHPVVRLDLGCGLTKPDGFIGIDRFALPGVDIVADLNLFLPFVENSVDLVLAIHSLEHVSNLLETMKEIYRICRHGAQVCIVAPYSQQSLNFANPFHRQVFNEHTPRFWTNSGTTLVDRSDYWNPHAETWGLAESDYTRAEMDFRCLRMEFFYFPEYRHLSHEEQRIARKKYMNVCDNIMYYLVVIKQPVSEGDMQEMAKKIDFYEPPYITVRKLKERCDSLEKELAQARGREKELQQTQAELHEALESRKKELQQTQDELQQTQHDLLEDRKELDRLQATLKNREAELEQVKNKGKLIANELDMFRHRKAIRWLYRIIDKSNLWNDISPSFQQLKDDSLIVNKGLKGYRLQLSINLKRVPFVYYPLEVNRKNLAGVLLAPVLDLPLNNGILGIEIISPDNKIVAQSTIPASQINESIPTHFQFSPIQDSDQGRFWLRVFVRDVDAPLRIFEWRKYSVFRLGPLRTRAFCGFFFEKAT